MVVDLRLRGRVGRRGLMFVPYYGKSRAFISNYKSWREYDVEGKTPGIASSIISHESIHLALNKFSLKASEKLDNLFGRSNSWEVCSHGLGDFKRYNKANGKRKRTSRIQKEKIYKFSIVKKNVNVKIFHSTRSKSNSARNKKRVLRNHFAKK